MQRSQVILISSRHRIVSFLNKKQWRKIVLFILQQNLNRSSLLKRLLNHILIFYTKKNSKEDTPLHIAARVGCLEIAELLASGHLDTKSQQVEANRELLRMVNLEKDTALHIAVKNGHFEIVELLIQKEKELTKFENANGESPLFLAVDRKHFKIACYILDSAPECYYQDSAPECYYQGRNKMNALHAAIILTRHNYKNVFSPSSTLKRVFSDLDGIPINPIVVCYRYVQFGIDFYRKHLVTRGSYDLVEEKFGIHGEGFMEKFINEFPCAIRESDEFGWTPLHYAAFLGNIIAVKLLLKNDNQLPHHVYQKDKEGLSALLIAAKEGHIQVMEQLIETFPDTCELLDKKGRNALHVAVKNGMLDTVKYVLKTPSLEGLINVQDKEGNASLHLAAIYGHYEIVKKLLDDTRVDKKAMNKEGFTAIKIIVSKMELINFKKSRIATKLLWAGGLPSLEGVLRRENAEIQTVEMKEEPQIESKKEPAQDKEIEGKEEPMKGTIVENLVLDNNTKRKPAEVKELKFNHLKEMARTHILVATIIATVTFAAGFTMPGGFKSDGPDEGMANLRRKAAFKLFLISDTIAFGSSATSMFFHFLASVHTNRHNFIYLIIWAALFTYLSIVAMVPAFLFGTNAVFAQSSGLSNANGALGCCFLILFYLVIPTL